MTHQAVADALEANAAVFDTMLRSCASDWITWKPAPEKWNLLEIICHLHDEEREDFRARIKSTLETPDEAWPAIDPPSWVTSRRYSDQNFEETLDKFLNERSQSVAWLRSLQNQNWDIAYQHPKVGPVSASLLLHNWLAHDYLHFRQITATKYQYLKQHSGLALDYAGNW